MFWLTTQVMPAISTAARAMSTSPMIISVDTIRVLPRATAPWVAWRG